MLAVFFPFFVPDTKITFVYNFVAPLNRFVKPWLPTTLSLSTKTGTS